MGVIKIMKVEFFTRGVRLYIFEFLFITTADTFCIKIRTLTSLEAICMHGNIHFVLLVLLLQQTSNVKFILNTLKQLSTTRK